jgi:hypothetical protein
MTTGVRSGWIANYIGLSCCHIMEMDQMMARLLAKMKAEIRTNEAKADTSLKEMMTRLEAMMQNSQEKMMAKLGAHHKIMMVRMDSQLEKMETTVETIRTRVPIWRPSSSRRAPPTAKEMDPG